MINFLKYRPLCGLLSVIMFAAFIGAFVYKKQTRGHAFNYSVEFVGGTQILLKFDNPVSSAHVKDVLEAAGFPGAQTREFSGNNEIIVRVKEVSTDLKGLSEKISEVLAEKMPENKATILKVDSVSSSIGQALSNNSILAIIIAMILMMIYIAFRFWSIPFGVGALVSLFHDAIAILLFFLLFDKDISANVICAVLTVLGYSINDTIVIFSSIRDRIKKSNGLPIEEIVNQSINKTLRRTTLTSFATTLVVVSLITLGGETLRDLSTALLIGIVFGTYSSIYIASPVMLLLYDDKQRA